VGQAQRAPALHRHQELPPPVVGDIEITYETMPLPANPGLVLTIYSPEPGTPSADTMTLLSTWATTHLADTTPAANATETPSQ
jgi:transcription regulator MmyB-like protein